MTRLAIRAHVAALVGALALALGAWWAPAPAAGAALAATEGAAFSGPVATLAVSGCGPFNQVGPATPASATIGWGDGTPPSPATVITSPASGQLEVSGAHTYAEAGARSVTVSGTWKCNVDLPAYPFSATVAARLADAPLSATGAAGLAATAGLPFDGTVATFTDANPGAGAGDHSATINWGDGTPASAGTVAAAGAGFAVSGGHAYATPGTRTVTVAIVDRDGAGAVATATLAVAAPSSRPSAAGLAIPSGVAAGGIALLGGAGARAAAPAVASFGWTVRGRGVLGGSAGVTCGPGDSEMRTSFARPGPVTVTLHVAYVSGATATFTRRLTVRGGRVSVPRARAVRLGQWFLCSRGPSDPALQATGNGGPPPGCQDEYVDGPLDVVGCLDPVQTLSGVPGPEQGLLQSYCYASGVCVRRAGGPVFHEGSSGAGRVGQAGARLPRPGAARGGAAGSIGGYRPCAGCGLRLPRDPPFLVSTRTVRVNGLDVTPDPGAAIALDTNDGRLVSSSATVSLLDGRLPLLQGLLWVPTYDTNGDIPLLDANLDQLEARYPGLRQLLDLAGFRLGGTLTVALVNRASRIGASLTLPASFTDPNGNAVMSGLTATADNRNGLVLDDLFANVPSATIGGALELDQLRFCYQRAISEGFCQRRTGADFGSSDGSGASSWNATGRVSILGVGIDAAPPPPTYGLGFVDGRFAFGGAAASFPDPGVPLGATGVDLTGLGASLGLDPTRFTGQIGLTAAGIVSIDGNLFMAFASPAHPYAFTGSELGACCSLPTPTVQTTAVAAGGDVGVRLPDPIGEQKLANGWAMYVYPGYLAADGSFGLNVFNGALAMNGAVQGQFDLGGGAFDVEGQVAAHLIFIDMSASGVVSSTGIGACGTTTVSYLIGSATVVAGGGYRWGDTFPSAWLGSCDLSPYRANVSAPQGQSDLAAPQEVRVPPGLPSEMIKLPGVGGAPDVTITGPGGLRASTAGGAAVFPKPFSIFRVPQQRTTYVAIVDPAPGDYTITPNPGSPPIAQVLHAEGIRPSVRARVVRRRGRLLVAYTVRPEPGQVVRLLERSPRIERLIGTTRRPRGTLPLVPAPGPAGRRMIVAEVVESGVPVVVRPGAPGPAAIQLPLASYTAPGPRRLGRAARVRVRHAGTRVLVAFRPVRGARRYAVAVALSNGERLRFPTTRPALAVGGVPGEIRGRLAVVALGDGALTRTGPPATAAIAAAHGG